MRGFPKHLNTKQDYLNCINEFPQETKNELQRLLDSRFVWVETAVLEDEEQGIIDDTHDIIKIMTEPGEPIIQRELIEDTNSELVRLGFTVEEVREMLKW